MSAQLVDEHLAWCHERIAAYAKNNDAVKTAATLLGIGPVTASAAIATVGDFERSNKRNVLRRLYRIHAEAAFERRRSLGGITKRGHTYLRSLLIQCAKSAFMTARRQQDRISQWTLALRERSGWQRTAMALATRNAQTLRAVMDAPRSSRTM